MARLAKVEIAAFAHSGGFGVSILPTAVAIAMAESGGDTSATNSNSNGTHDWGLFQINDVHHPNDGQKTDPLLNSQMAYSIYQQAGNSFKPWSTYNSGSYKSHMKDATDAVAGLQKLGPEQERKIVAGHASRDKGVPLKKEFGTPTDAASAIGGLSGTITSAVNGIGSKITELAINGGVLVVGIIVIVLGVVLVLRKEGVKVGANVAKAIL